MLAPALRGAHVGLLAVDHSTGAVLYQRGADDDFVPASTFKLIVGSAAMSRLGPSFAFVTEVDDEGGIVAGTLSGNLYLRGGGDAELSPSDLDAAATAVAAAGVQRVEGALVADSSHYVAPRYPGGWAIDDIPYGYAAVPAALTLEMGVAHVRISPGALAGEPAVLQSDPSDAFQLDNATVTGVRGSDDTTDIDRPWDRPDAIRVVGSYPLGAPLSDDLEPAVPDPVAYAAQAFRAALLRHGIDVLGGVRDGRVPAAAHNLWTHRSKPLSQLLADFWLPSRNVIGEQLLEELGASSTGNDARAAGIEDETQWLRAIGVDPATLTIADGSGLSSYDRITPRALVAILNADYGDSNRDAFLAALPVAGLRGTLEGTFAGTPLAGNLIAKTGSLNHARLLAGFVKRSDGDIVTFALMVNDWMDASPHAQAALDTVRAAMLEALL